MYLDLRQLSRILYDSIVFRGGLDLITPTLSTPSGYVRDSVNFEIALTGGYSRIEGYERYDGRPSPSGAIPLLVFIDPFLDAPGLGDTVTGATSGASGEIVEIGANYVALAKAAGVFLAGETLMDGALNLGVAAQVGGSLGAERDAIIQAKAADVYRADILAVPGEGSVLGVFVFDDDTYAVRNNVGSTKAVFWRETTAGWVEVPYYRYVPFTDASGEIDDGDDLNQGVNLALIKRVVIQSGSLEAGNAAGMLVIETPAPGPMAVGAATVTGGGTGALTLTAADTEISRLPGGSYETIIANFTGASVTRRIYGVCGNDTAFEFDGDVYVPIASTAVPDTPRSLIEFKQHLFLGIQSSLLHSAPGRPYVYQAINNASEIGLGDEVQGLVLNKGDQAGGALAAYCRNSIHMIYGTGAADWQRIQYGQDIGALRHSVQYLGEPIAMDDRGVLTLSASLNYGNFDQSTLTYNIQPLITRKRTRVEASCINRTKSQYRLFFTDGSGLWLTLANKKYLGAMPVEFPHRVACVWSGEMSNGAEVTFFGSDNGFVYQMDKGFSFDGAALPANFTMVFSPAKSPRARKQYRHAAVEVTGTGYARFRFGYLLGYGKDTIPQPSSESYETSFSGSAWDAFTWDAFYWDGLTLLPAEVSLRGTGENIAVTISSGDNYIAPFTVNSMILHYSLRRALR